MIAHIRQPKRQESASPIVRARHMVAETLLPEVPQRRRQPLRKIVFFSGLAFLAAAAALAFYLCR
jgi:hypothetical protein